MPQWFTKKIKEKEQSLYVTPKPPPTESIRLTGSAEKDLSVIRAALHDTADFLAREITVCGIPVKLMMFEGMFSLQTLTEIMLEPLGDLVLDKPSPEELRDWILHRAVLGMDQNEVETLGELFPFLMSGFAGIMIDGIEKVIVAGVQGFQFRSVSEPSAEENVRGSREGFTEPIRINMTMVRRRVKSSTLKMELMKAGVKSHTDLCLIYQTDMVAPELLRDIRRRIQEIPTDIILESGYVQPFLDTDITSIFSNVGTTQRPDTLCAKISEGRVGILVDGTPFALIVPYFFNENFQSIDDYTHRPYYAVFERWLKYLAFFFTILLPGFYVAVGTFHPELLPEALLLNVTAAEQDVPFPLVIEALLIHFIYELMREAGLRLPRPIGHAIGIIGALVIGDAAVTAGADPLPHGHGSSADGIKLFCGSVLIPGSDHHAFRVYHHRRDAWNFRDFSGPCPDDRQPLFGQRLWHSQYVAGIAVSDVCHAGCTAAGRMEKAGPKKASKIQNLPGTEIR